MRPTIVPSPNKHGSNLLKGLGDFFGRKLGKTGRIFILLVPFLFIIYSTLTTYVRPGWFAVRQVYFGSKAGIRSEVYGTGLFFMIPGIERLHLFPSDLMVVNFSDSTSEASAEIRPAPAIKVQTSDGYSVQLDVSFLYKIVDPYRVFLESGPGRSFEDRLVVPRADQVLRKSLGELNSEEFYQGPKRIEKALIAEKQLSQMLAAFGIKVEAVLVRRFVYDDKYQELIEGRKIKDQTVFLRQAEAKSAIEQRKRDTIVAEGKANQEVEIARGQADVSKIKSQADLIRRSKASEGRLLVELAEAKGTELENAALQGAGSENMVGLKMAEALKGVEILALPSDGKDAINPLDLALILKKFEVH